MDPAATLQHEVPRWAWLPFAIVVAVGLVVDLLAHRGARGNSRSAAIGWSVAWISVSLAFAGWIAVQFGGESAEDFLAAYLTEKSLSFDNLFVFMLLFQRLGLPRTEQHRVLFWGILGALLSRAIFIGSGVALVARWHGVLYVVGVFLVFLGWRTALHGNAGEEEAGPAVLLPFLQRHFRFTTQLHGHRFVAIENGVRVATPLLLAIPLIELTDIAFAFDSVPAAFAISGDPFIVYSSNVFAILGMRALYLVIADVVKDMKYLYASISAILVFAGAKMLTARIFPLPHVV